MPCSEHHPCFHPEFLRLSFGWNLSTHVPRMSSSPTMSLTPSRNKNHAPPVAPPPHLFGTRNVPPGVFYLRITNDVLFLRRLLAPQC